MGRFVIGDCNGLEYRYSDWEVDEMDIDFTRIGDSVITGLESSFIGKGFGIVLTRLVCEPWLSEGSSTDRFPGFEIDVAP
jgi:hypothetical protein